MGNLLFAENPLVVNPALAREIGLNEAIVLQQIHYWLEINKKTKNNFRDGRFWTYNTIENWQSENFPFFSVDTVKRTLKSLEKMQLLITGNYNAKSFDHTKWYTIDYDALEKLGETPDKPRNSALVQNALIDECKMPQSKSADCPDPSVQNAPMEEGNLHPTIPETTTETNTEITTEKKDSSSKQSFDSGSDQAKVIDYFVKRLLGVNPSVKVPKTPKELNNWRIQIDRMMRIDKRDKTEICKVIQFATSDPFWMSVILSPKSLREKYDTLKIRMDIAESKQPQATPQTPVATSPWDAVAAETRAYIENVKRGVFD